MAPKQGLFPATYELQASHQKIYIECKEAKVLTLIQYDNEGNVLVVTAER